MFTWERPTVYTLAHGLRLAPELYIIHLGEAVRSYEYTHAPMVYGSTAAARNGLMQFCN